MRRRLLALLAVLLLWSAPSYAAVTVLQAPTAVENNASAGTIALAFGSGVQAGSLLWCHLSFDQPAGSVSGVADSLNGAWTFAVGITNTPNTQRSELWYRRNSAAGSAPTVTVTFTGTPDFRRLAIAEVGGLLDAAPDQMTAAIGTSTAPNSGAVTPSVNGEYIAGGLQYNGTTISNLNGFTEEAVSASKEDSIVDQVQAVAASIAVSVTLAGSQPWASLIMTFAPATATCRRTLLGVGC